MKKSIRAYMDLTRLHFFFVWPILFCAGLSLAFISYNNFSWSLVLRALLIGFFGFEAGLVLNDIVDYSVDQKEVEFDKLTKYWRVFGNRPISQGLVSKRKALTVFALLVAITTVLIFTLPIPNSLYVFSIMVICYCLEWFYQIKKRNQHFPFAQLIGRIDFTLFPIAGYLCVGHLDITTLVFALFFYPFALAHLGVNDLCDVVNDRVKNLKTIPMLYGMKGTAYWILLFTLLHIASSIIFLTLLGTLAIVGFATGFLLLSIANYKILKGKNALAGMKVLPLFHLTLLIYAISIILSYVV